MCVYCVVVAETAGAKRANKSFGQGGNGAGLKRCWAVGQGLVVVVVV